MAIEFLQHKDTVKISSNTVDDVTALLEESLVTLSNTLGARFVDIIRDKVQDFYSKLQYIENLMQEW